MNDCLARRIVFAGAAAFTLREDMIAPNDLPTVPEGKRLAAIMPVAGGLVIVLLLGAVLGSALQFVPLFLINLYESGQVAKAIPLRSFLSTALLSMVMLRLVLFRLLSDAARHRLLVFCHTGIILTLLAIPLIRSIWSSVALAVAFGLSYGLLYPTMNALVLNRTAEHWRGRVSGLLTLLFESGFRGFALIAGTVSFYLGYAAMFYVLAAVYSLGLFFYWLLDRCRY